jgi:hypothetical protein
MTTSSTYPILFSEARMYRDPRDMTPEEREYANCTHPQKRVIKTERICLGPVAPGAYNHRYEVTPIYRCPFCNLGIVGESKIVIDGPPAPAVSA